MIYSYNRFWIQQNLSCHFCGTRKSVKYVDGSGHPVCNRCTYNPNEVTIRTEIVGCEKYLSISDLVSYLKKLADKYRTEATRVDSSEKIRYTSCAKAIDVLAKEVTTLK